MTIEENKRRALKFFEAVATGDTQSMGMMMTDDATWWVAPSNKFSGEYQKADFLNVVPELFKEADGPFTFRFDDITAEADRVSITAKGNLKLRNGKTYASDYHFLLTFRDGKIAKGKEYADSAHINDIFGAP